MPPDRRVVNTIAPCVGPMIAGVLRARSAALVLLAATVASPAGASDFDRALETANWHLESRLRYEHVDDDVLANAEALTLGTRFGYESGSYQGFSVLAELIDVRTLFGINDLAPRRPGFAVIADPPTPVTGTSRPP
ncbi:MAG: hypothetical protein EA417_15550 [Gammaproteobacteria bacterium]|nr:MAG: hypothetical protein EA417_15550 [Gammaproteobacteria bacterium]